MSLLSMRIKFGIFRIFDLIFLHYKQKQNTQEPLALEKVEVYLEISIFDFLK